MRLSQSALLPALLAVLLLHDAAAAQNWNKPPPPGRPPVPTPPEDRDGKMEQLLNSIRWSRGALSQFFYGFPKGSELHYHYSGGIPTEDLIQTAIDNAMWLCPATSLVISKNITIFNDPRAFVSCPATPPALAGGTGGWVPLKDLLQPNGILLPAIRNQLLQDWSIYNYQPKPNETNADHFFVTFEKFGWVKDYDVSAALYKARQRAIKENVAYMEIMLIGPPQKVDLSSSFEAPLLEAAEAQNAALVMTWLETIYQSVPPAKWDQAAAYWAGNVSGIHNGVPGGLPLDDDKFTMRYLAYTVRVLPPLTVFQSIVQSFLAVQKSTLLNGAQLVGAENNPVSLRDYWLHMQMFKFCSQKWPSVKVALHAGEFQYDLVSEDNLRFHVKEAVRTAGAKRVGHGVALPWEYDSASTLDFMRTNDIALELLLNSNEFILPLSVGDQHSLPIYIENNVPIVISSDDPGILRTTLTREYVTLAFKFQYVKYDQIKTMAINGIKYSFIKDAALKARILKQVQDAFVAFEADFSRIAARVQRALMKETDTAAVKASLAAIRSLTA